MIRLIADLHLHTNESDGTWNPDRLVAKAAEHNLAVIAITDHDTTAGVEEAVQAAPAELKVIPGVELSCGGANVESVHMLGLWIDVDSSSLQEQLELMRTSRIRRMEEILHRLRKMGIALSFEEVAKYAHKDVISRSHVASALVDRGVVNSKAEAFQAYIGETAPAYVPRLKFRPETAIELILAAGGVPVLAHPGLLESLHILPRLVDAGLVGMEVVHPSHSPEQTESYLELAQEWNLLPSGGSDCHGPGGKDELFIGRYTIPLAWVEALSEARW